MDAAFLFTLLLVCYAPKGLCQQITEPPKDQVTHPGGDVQFHVRYERSKEPSKNVFVVSFLTGDIPTALYQIESDGTIDKITEKDIYELTVHGDDGSELGPIELNFTIPNVQDNSVKNYEFKFKGGSDSPKKAQLFIMTSLDSVFPGEIQPRDEATATCTLGLISVDPLSSASASLPEISAYLGDTKLDDPPDVSANDTYMAKDYALDVTKEMNLQQFTCVVNFTSAGFTNQSSTTINVQWPVANVMIHDIHEDRNMTVGENLTCTGDGNPEANKTVWSNSTTEFTDPVLAITNSMAGTQQTWTCTLFNYVQDQEHSSIATASFYVDPNNGPNPTDGATEAWVIAVAVCVPLAVIVAAAIGIFVWWNKTHK